MLNWRNWRISRIDGIFYSEFWEKSVKERRGNAKEQRSNSTTGLKLELLRNVVDLGRQGAEAVSIGCCWWLSGFLGSTGARRAILDTQTDFFKCSAATHRQHKDNKSNTQTIYNIHIHTDSTDTDARLELWDILLTDKSKVHTLHSCLEKWRRSEEENPFHISFFGLRLSTPWYVDLRI